MVVNAFFSISLYLKCIGVNVNQFGEKKYLGEMHGNATL